MGIVLLGFWILVVRGIDIGLVVIGVGLLDLLCVRMVNGLCELIFMLVSVGFLDIDVDFLEEKYKVWLFGFLFNKFLICLGMNWV